MKEKTQEGDYIMLFPKPLKAGDRVAVIGLSSWAPEERIDPAMQAVKDRGFEVVEYPTSRAKHWCFSGTDEQRAKDFEDAMCDDSIDGVFCIRGGYGAARALELVDWAKVKAAVERKPKYFSGYSDVTAAHVALNEICHLVTWHTPMPSTEWIKGLDEYTERYLSGAIFGDPVTELYNPEGVELQVLKQGKATGQLVGGNLSLLAAAIGTDFDFDAKGKIIFIEDIGEPQYRIDRMLIQMRQAGKFRDAAGVIIGAWTDCGEKDPDAEFPLMDILEDIFGKLDIPVVMNFRCGHCLPTASLPLGATVTIDNGKMTIEK